MRRLIFTAFLLCTALAWGVEKYDESTFPRRSKDFVSGRDFYAKHGKKEWEIKAIFKHEDGYLGSFKVGESVAVGFTIGVVGERTAANVKSFPFPHAEVHIMDGDKVKEILKMKGCSN